MASENRSKSRQRKVGDISEWLIHARAGSNSSLGQALESYRNYLRIVAARELPKKLRSKESVSDLVQRALHQGAKDFPRFRGNGEMEFRAWLHAILRAKSMMIRRQFNAAMRKVDREVSFEGRDCGRRVKAHPQAREAEPIEVILRRERSALVKEALERLELEDRQVIELCQKKLRDTSWSEIGSALGVSAGAARARWYRALEKLRHSLKSAL